MYSDFCFKLGSNDSHFNVLFIQWGANSHNSICKPELLKWKESRSEESPALIKSLLELPAERQYTARPNRFTIIYRSFDFMHLHDTEKIAR